MLVRASSLYNAPLFHREIYELIDVQLNFILSQFTNTSLLANVKKAKKLSEGSLPFVWPQTARHFKSIIWINFIRIDI